ncbi:MAG: zf-HC2 domain-containing protein, partial [Leptolyngbya sp.]|nr:zf-HC2 domain-containing protein [Leptolyngbya sp.]
MKRDRFELLSAYLDGEVTPEERRLVQTWLSQDPTAKCLYDRLTVLRHGLRETTHPDSCEAEETLAGVFRCLSRRFRMVIMAGTGVAVLGVLNLLSGTVGGTSQGSLAHRPTNDWVLSNTLQITLDQPAFPIPSPVATPVEGMNRQ